MPLIVVARSRTSLLGTSAGRALTGALVATLAVRAAHADPPAPASSSPAALPPAPVTAPAAPRRGTAPGATPAAQAAPSPSAVITPLAPPPPPPVPEPVPATRPTPGMPVVTFVDAVRRALARNPTLAAAEADIRRAQALVEEVRAGSLPTLYANGVYTRLDHDRVLPSGQLAAGANQFNGNLLLAVPIVAPQRWTQWARAGDNVTVARSNAADARRQVAVATARAYLTLASQHRIIATLERARVNAVAHHAFARARFAGGLGNRIDEVRAAQEVASDDALIAAQYQQLARQQEALGVLIASNGPVDALADAPDMNTPSQAAALAGASHRTDVALSTARVATAEHIARDTWADYMPSLVGTFQPFYQNPATFTQPQFGWQAQLVLSVPLYDGGFRYGAGHERRALVDQARASLEATMRQARSDVRAAFTSVRRADEALAAARQAAQLAQEALALAETAYRAGATTNLEVIDAQRRARDAAAQAAAVEDNARQARLDVLIAAGAFP